MSASHERPWVRAAVLASTPNVDALFTAYGPSDSRWAPSVGLTISWAHLRPGRFHALDVDVAVTVWAAVTSERLAYGTWWWPGYTSGAWISSAKTSPPWRSTTAAMASSSADSSTRPSGLYGLHSTIRWPPAANAPSRASRS